MAIRAWWFVILAMLLSAGKIAAQDPAKNWQTIPLHSNARVRSIVGTDEGLFAGSDTGELIQFLSRALDDPQIVTDTETPIERVTSTLDGLHLGLLGKDGSMRLIVPNTKKQTAFEGTIDEPVLDMVLSSDDRIVAVGKSGTLYTWSGSGLSSQPLNLSEPLALAPNGGYVAGWRDEDGLVVLDAGSGAVAYALKKGLSAPSAISISPTNRVLAAADGTLPGLVRLWDLRNGELVQTLAVPGKQLVRLLFDRQETRITCIDEEGNVFEVNIESGEVRRVGKTALPEVSVASIVKNTTLNATYVCSINDNGDIVVPTAKGVAAAAAPAEGFVTIPVFVATNRARSSPPTFFGGFFIFFARLLGLVALALAILACAICAFAIGKKAVWLAAGISIVLLSVLAGGDAIAKIRGYDPARKDMFEPAIGEMTYGVCPVTVPTSGRRKGQLNSPLKIWVFEKTADPNFHIILRQPDVLKRDELFAKVKERVAGSPRNEAFIFIHGYNVTFEDSVRRTAQLAYDLGFTGAPICFSWPSFAAELLYSWDVRNADDSVPQLQQFLKDVAAKSGATRIHVIAHSMGNRILSQAIETDPGIFQEPTSAFRHLVLAAPDVDKDLFLSRIAPKLAACKQSITLYASSHDYALVLSKRFNGQPRAGDTKPKVTCFQGIDSIDCSEASSGGLGHSYVSDEPEVLSDLFYLLADKPAGERFGMERVTEEKDAYWRIRR